MFSSRLMSSKPPVVNSDDDSDFDSRYKPSSSYGHSSQNITSARGGSSRDNFTRDSRDNFTRDARDIRDNHVRDSRDNFTRDSRDSYGRDTRDNYARDNYGRESRDNFSRDGRDNFSRDMRRETSFNRDSEKNNETSKYANYRNSKINSDSSDNEPSSSRYGANSRRIVRNSSDSDEEERFDRRRSGVFNKSRDSSRPMTSSRKDKDSMLDNDSYDGANQKLKMMIQWDKSLCEQLDDIYEAKLAKEKKIEQLKEETHKDTIKEEGLRKKLSELRMNRKMLQSRLDEFK